MERELAKHSSDHIRGKQVKKGGGSLVPRPTCVFHFRLSSVKHVESLHGGGCCFDINIRIKST